MKLTGYKVTFEQGEYTVRIRDKDNGMILGIASFENEADAYSYGKAKCAFIDYCSLLQGEYTCH